MTSAAISPAISGVGIRVAPTEWESARAAHVWLTPQRVNLIANPSFETSTYPWEGVAPLNITQPTYRLGSFETEDVWTNGMWGWRTNANALAVTPSGTDPQALGPEPRSQACHLQLGFLAPGAPMVLESNLFPTSQNPDEFFSVEAAVAGNGRCRIGVVFYDLSGVVGSYAHSEWFSVNAGVMLPIRALVESADRSMEACFRLEWQGDGGCWVDNCMVDNNAAQLGYIDGDWYTGQPGDFGWYDYRHRSFSMYYNDRRNMDSYLFGYNDQGARDGFLSEISLSTIESPRPDVTVDIGATCRDVRDDLIQLGRLTAVVQRGPYSDPTDPNSGVDVGQVSVNDLTTTVRYHGKAWDQVPQGAQVVAQWDDIYGYRTPCWPGDLFVRLYDYVFPYKSTVTILS